MWTFSCKTPRPDNHAELCKRLQQQLTKGEEDAVSEAFHTLMTPGLVPTLAFGGQTGSRTVQMAFEAECPQSKKNELAAAMQGYSFDAALHPDANFLLNKILETTPGVTSEFVVRELCDSAGQVAQHKFGYKVLQRCFEYASEELKSELADSVMASGVDKHCSDRYGTHVIRHILEHGSVKHKEKIAAALQQNLSTFATNKYASHVVESALVHCADQSRRELAAQLQGNLTNLSADLFGHKVLWNLAQQPEQIQAMRELVARFRPALMETKYGRKLLHDVCPGPA